VQLGAVTPNQTWPKVQVRGGTHPRFINGGVVQCEIDLANYHPYLDFYVVRTSCPNHVPLGCTEGVDYFPVAQVSGITIPPDPDPGDGVPGPPPYVEVTLPEIPETRYGSFRVVAHDTWSRPQNNPSGVSSWRNAANPVNILEPPYPLVYGFNFFNQADGVNWEEFTSVYEMNAFADPLFCVPWPHYLIWFGPYAALAGDGGTCVGISVTSRRLFNGEYNLSAWDPDAIFPNGHRNGPLVDLNAGIPDADPFFGPTPPKPSGWDFAFPCRFLPGNMWGETVRNHGKQLSQEMMESLLPQLTGAGSGATRRFSHDGEPTLVFSRVAANPADYVLCMSPQVGAGHCVTPFRVEYGKRHGRPQPAGSPPEPRLVDDPDFNLIHVYDSNGPDRVRYIDIDTVRDQFWFPYGKWNTNGTEDPADDTPKYSGRAIHAHPIALFRGPKHMISPRLETLVHILVFGSADVLHRDTEGGSWGWDAAGDYHDDIEGAKSQALFAELEIPSGRAHQLFLPVSKQLIPSEINVRRDGDYGFYAAQGGALFRLMVDNALEGETDGLQLLRQGDGSLDGFELTPVPGPRQFQDIIVGLVPSETESVSFTLSDVFFAAGRGFAARALREDMGFSIRFDSPDPNETMTFGVTVRTADSEAQAFRTEEIKEFYLPAGATVGVSLPHWPAFDRILRTLDLESDGVPELSLLSTAGDPVIGIDFKDGNARVTYPIAYAGWTLEEASHPDGPWSTASGGITERTEEEYAVVVPSGVHKVYRLRLP
jgi:hypothetical protein